MKTRNGFVSNSSSSSFVIISKNGELTEDKLHKALGDIAKDFCMGESVFFSGILDCIEEAKTVSVGWYRSSEVPLSAITNDDIHIYHGEHPDNEGNKVHCALCDVNLTAETDEVKIIWEHRG